MLNIQKKRNIVFRKEAGGGRGGGCGGSKIVFFFENSFKFGTTVVPKMKEVAMAKEVELEPRGRHPVADLVHSRVGSDYRWVAESF